MKYEVFTNTLKRKNIMSKKKILLFAAACCPILNSATLLYSQVSKFSRVYFGGQGNAVVKTTDNRYIIAGSTYNEALVYKIDSTGDVLWSKNIGNNKSESFYSIISTSDSAYIAVGNNHNTGDSTSDIFCIKINSNGDILWTKEINMGGYNDYALSVQQTFDKGFIIAGYSTQKSTLHSMIAVVKLDAFGNLTWGKTFPNGNYNAFASSIKQMPDSGYVVIGYTDSLTTSTTGTILMRLTPAGNVSWVKTQVFASANYTQGCDVIATGNGLICSMLTVVDNFNYCVLMKTDTAGNVLWSKRYSAEFYPYYYYQYPPFPKIHYMSGDKFLFISGKGLVIVDTAGNSTLTKSWNIEMIIDFLITKDKGFMIIGYPWMATKKSVTMGNYSNYSTMIKSDSSGYPDLPYCYDGNYASSFTAFPVMMSSDSLLAESKASVVVPHPVITNTSCYENYECDLPGDIKKNTTDENTIQVYPNPTESTLTIEVRQCAAIEILNIQGRLLKTFITTSNKTNIDVSAFTSGMYFVEVKTEKGIVAKKFIKE